MILNPELAEQAKVKMTSIIEQGRQKAINGMDSMFQEYKVRRDYLVNPMYINYWELNNQVMMSINLEAETLKEQPTNYALDQLLSRIKMPKLFYNNLNVESEDNWSRDLLVENLSKLTTGNVKEKLLFRVVGDKIKGILSNQYRRMDASPVFEAFLKTGIAHGLIPCDGMNTDTRYHVKMMHPEVYEPVQGEVVGFGLSLTTSDYGNGALQMQMFIMRVFCTNLAIGEDVLRKIHIGKRFDDSIPLSQRTYELDTKAVGSAVHDIVGDHFQSKVKDTLELIERSNGKEINIENTLKNLRDRGSLNKSQALAAKELYDNNATELLPKQEGAWRFSNVLSLMAQNQDMSGDVSLKLQEEAFAVLN